MDEQLEHVNWKGVMEELEAEFALSRNERMHAKKQKLKVEKALLQAEALSVDFDIIDRLDMMLMVLTEAAKENVCTNMKCPHYNNKCKMR
jgi:hypothetical protein